MANSLRSNNINEDICIIDSETTHTILKHKKYFSYLEMGEINVNTICGSAKLIESSGRANILLPGRTKLVIDHVLFSKKSRRNLLSYKDIHRNGYHIETVEEENNEYLCITNIISGKKYILEKLSSFSSGLYYTRISIPDVHDIVD